MTPTPDNPWPQERPEFMATLGLLPPYSPEDVRMAYRTKALLAHPDRGGSASEFVKLHEAYERAREYAAFYASRRQWLGVQVEHYLRQEDVVAEVRRLGGQVELETLGWLHRWIGEDFAAVTERLRGVRLRGLADGDAALNYLAAHKPALQYLASLDLAGTRLSDEALLRLGGLEVLRRLDLAGTPVSGRGLRVLRALPELEWLNLGGTSVGLWGRWRLRRSFPRLQVVSVRHPGVPSVPGRPR
jgi:hypothetical protein